MTGYGSGVVSRPDYKITAELRSLNSKQLDLSLRMPSTLRPVEPAVRSVVSGCVVRGKAEVSVSVESLKAAAGARLNIAALESYKAQLTEAAGVLGLAVPENMLGMLLRMPDIYVSESDDESVSEMLAAAVDEAVRMACDNFVEFRKTEGERLCDFLRQRALTIRDYLDEVPRYEAERLMRVRQRLEEGLASVPHVEYDRGRLEQEMIFYIEKLDVNEEKQRLGQHIAYFLETLDDEPGQGKKLGFIAQEMGREINTMGSKSNHAEMQRLVVRMKDELEQIKEQVLNVF